MGATCAAGSSAALLTANTRGSPLDLHLLTWHYPGDVGPGAAPLSVDMAQAARFSATCLPTNGVGWGKARPTCIVHAGSAVGTSSLVGPVNTMQPASTHSLAGKGRAATRGTPATWTGSREGGFNDTLPVQQPRAPMHLGQLHLLDPMQAYEPEPCEGHALLRPGPRGSALIRNWELGRNDVVTYGSVALLLDELRRLEIALGEWDTGTLSISRADRDSTAGSVGIVV